MVGAHPRVLVLACGNPARLDDGLGPALAESLEQERIEGVTVDAVYQWTVEDAYDVSKYDVAVLVDASVSGPEPFFFRTVQPSGDLTFSSHSVTPEVLLGIARRLFHAKTVLYLQGIRGYVFDDFGEHLSRQAQSNLAQARRFLVDKLTSLDLSALDSLASPASTGFTHAMGECRSAASCRRPGLELK